MTLARLLTIDPNFQRDIPAAAFFPISSTGLIYLQYIYQHLLYKSTINVGIQHRYSMASTKYTYTLKLITYDLGPVCFFEMIPKKKHGGSTKNLGSNFRSRQPFQEPLFTKFGYKTCCLPRGNPKVNGGNTDDERQVLVTQVPSVLTWGDHNVHWAHLRFAEHSLISSAPLSVAGFYMCGATCALFDRHVTY